MSEDLPDPLGPTMARCSPEKTVRVTSSSTARPPLISVARSSSRTGSADIYNSVVGFGSTESEAGSGVASRWSGSVRSDRVRCRWHLRSPAAEARPVLQLARAVGGNYLVAVELRGRGAGVVGKDAQAAAHGQLRRCSFLTRPHADDAVLLGSIRHDPRIHHAP